MSKQPKVPATDEAWDSGELGRDEQYVKRAEVDFEEEARIDKSLDLQLISIRLPKSLIEDFKYLGQINGLGYQPLMRQVLKRFAHCEKKNILRERAAAQTEARKQIKKDDPPTKHQKAA